MTKNDKKYTINVHHLPSGNKWESELMASKESAKISDNIQDGLGEYVSFSFKSSSKDLIILPGSVMNDCVFTIKEEQNG